jgi:hypothetical protein
MPAQLLDIPIAKLQNFQDRRQHRSEAMVGVLGKLCRGLTFACAQAGIFHEAKLLLKHCQSL